MLRRFWAVLIPCTLVLATAPVQAHLDPPGTAIRVDIYLNDADAHWWNSDGWQGSVANTFGAEAERYWELELVFSYAYTPHDMRPDVIHRSIQTSFLRTGATTSSHSYWNPSPSGTDYGHWTGPFWIRDLVHNTPASERLLWSHIECTPRDTITITMMAFEEDFGSFGQSFLAIVSGVIATSVGYGIEVGMAGGTVVAPGPGTAVGGTAGALGGLVVGILLALPVAIWGGHDPLGAGSVTLPLNGDANLKTAGIGNGAATALLNVVTTPLPASAANCGTATPTRTSYLSPREPSLQGTYVYGGLHTALARAEVVEPSNPDGFNAAQQADVNTATRAMLVSMGEWTAGLAVENARTHAGNDVAYAQWLAGRAASDPAQALALFQTSYETALAALAAPTVPDGIPALGPTVFMDGFTSGEGQDGLGAVFVYGDDATLSLTGLEGADTGGEVAGNATHGALFPITWPADATGSPRLSWTSSRGAGDVDVAFRQLAMPTGDPAPATGPQADMAARIQAMVDADYNPRRQDFPGSALDFAREGIYLSVEGLPDGRAFSAHGGGDGAVHDVQAIDPATVAGQEWSQDDLDALDVDAIKTAVGAKHTIAMDAAVLEELLGARARQEFALAAIASGDIRIDGGNGGWTARGLRIAERFAGDAPFDKGTVTLGDVTGTIEKSPVGYRYVRQHGDTGALMVVSPYGRTYGTTTPASQYLAGIQFSSNYSPSPTCGISLVSA